MGRIVSITAPTAATVARMDVVIGAAVSAGDTLGLLVTAAGELPVRSAAAGIVKQVYVAQGDSVRENGPICAIRLTGKRRPVRPAPPPDLADKHGLLEQQRARLRVTLDEGRATAVAKRRERGYRTARE
ncbi:MAG: biotin/lipoyl-containing protein, partial [Porticoccaceae bacterium]